MSKTIRSGAFDFTATVSSASADKVRIVVVADATGMDQVWTYMRDGGSLRLISVAQTDSTEIEYVRPELRKALAPMARAAAKAAA